MSDAPKLALPALAGERDWAAAAAAGAVGAAAAAAAAAAAGSVGAGVAATLAPSQGVLPSGWAPRGSRARRKGLQTGHPLQSRPAASRPGRGGHPCRPGGGGRGPGLHQRPCLGLGQALAPSASVAALPLHPAVHVQGQAALGPALPPRWPLGLQALRALLQLGLQLAGRPAADPAVDSASAARLEWWRGCPRRRCPCQARRRLGAAPPAPDGLRCPPHWHQGWSTAASPPRAGNRAGRWPSLLCLFGRCSSAPALMFPNRRRGGGPKAALRRAGAAFCNHLLCAASAPLSLGKRANVGEQSSRGLRMTLHSAMRRSITASSDRAPSPARPQLISL